MAFEVGQYYEGANASPWSMYVMKIVSVNSNGAYDCLLVAKQNQWSERTTSRWIGFMEFLDSSSDAFKPVSADDFHRAARFAMQRLRDELQNE